MGIEFHYREGTELELEQFVSLCHRQAKRALKREDWDEAALWADKMERWNQQLATGHRMVLVQVETVAGRVVVNSIGLGPDPATWPDGRRYRCKETCQCRRSIKPVGQLIDLRQPDPLASHGSN